MTEEWKSIPGYEGLYEVSNFGQVRSLPRNTTKGKILAQHKRPNGYRGVGLHKDGALYPHSTQRLVADAFIPNPTGMRTLRYIDGDSTNNRADNLEWNIYKERTSPSIPRVVQSGKMTQNEYAAVHQWIKYHYGKAGDCELCGKPGPNQWSNISGEYKKDRSDFRPLCAKCHRRVDVIGSLDFCRNGHEFTEDNTYTNRRGHRECYTCRREYSRNYRIKLKERSI